LIAHLITHGITQILGDGELVGCVPSGRRWDLPRVIVIVADPGPLDDDLAEGGLEGGGSCPATLEAAAAFAVPTLEDEFLVGLLD
jgi:hypothetical protein